VSKLIAKQESQPDAFHIAVACRQEIRSTADEIDAGSAGVRRAVAQQL